MQTIRAALNDFWNGFYNRSGLLPSPVPIQAFPEGYPYVRDTQGRPVAAPFPYITYQVTRAAFGDVALTTASIWDRDAGNPGAFGRVDDIIVQIADRITENGVLLSCGQAGAVWLARVTPFVQYLDDPDDRDIVRGIIRVAIYNYVL